MLHSYRHVSYVIRKTYFSNMFRIFKAMARLLLHNVKFDNYIKQLLFHHIQTINEDDNLY